MQVAEEELLGITKCVFNARDNLAGRLFRTGGSWCMRRVGEETTEGSRVRVGNWHLQSWPHSPCFKQHLCVTLIASPMLTFHGALALGWV